MSELVQVRNNELVDLLSVDFQKRVEPNFAWKSAVSTLQVLPVVRGVWPMSGMSSNNDPIDVIGSRNLATRGNPQFGYANLIPYCAYDGVGDYQERNSAFYQITGTETTVIPAVRGLTLGGWFYFDDAAGAVENVFTKWLVAGNLRSYRLLRIASGEARFSISSDGTAIENVDSGGTVLTAAANWYFLVGRFIPSSEIKVWVNGQSNTAATATAAIFDSAVSNLVLGGEGGGLLLMTGRTSQIFICAAALSDAIVSAVFQQTRSMFNV